MRVGKLLRALGYSLQGNAKQVEGRQHPDRDGQFSHINALAGRYLKAGDPVISIDAKNKELLRHSPGDNNKGIDWHRQGQPPRVGTHDFPTRRSPRPSATGLTTWPPTPAGSRSAAMVTPQLSPSPRYDAGGNTSADPATSTPHDC